jgi:hypothetical protein
MTAPNSTEHVLAAIRANRFRILTLGDYRSVIQYHAHAIATDRPPQAAPIW